MSSLVSYEPLVDSTIDVFLDQTQSLFANTGESCNFSRWLQFFAADVIGDLTWSRRLGFVEKNEDVDGIIGFLGGFLSYAGPVSLCQLCTYSKPLHRTIPLTQYQNDKTQHSTDRSNAHSRPFLGKEPYKAPSPTLGYNQKRIPCNSLRPIPLRRTRRRNGQDQSLRPASAFKQRCGDRPAL